MTKKNKLIKPVVIGTVATIITITIVFLLYPNILSEEIITTKTNEEIIKEGIEAGLLEIPFECIIESECEDGQAIISDPIDTNPIEEIIDPKPINATDVIPELVCEPPNEIIDNVCILFVPPIIEPPLVELVSKVIKIDNNGTKFESSISSIIPQLSFFVEDTTDLDFDNGFIENELIINTEPMISVSGNGFFDIQIGNQTILTEPIKISVSGMTDEDGQIKILFVSPLGTTSDKFLFQFKDNIDRFDIQGLTKMEYQVSGLTLIVNDFQFGFEKNTIFEMGIAREPNKIIIIDEQGEKLRVFPTDSKVILSSNTGKYTYKICTQRASSFGCQRYRTASYAIGAPQVGAWKFFKLNDEGIEELITEGVQFSKSTPLNELVQRNEIYKLQIGSPTSATIKWKASVEQEIYRFSCTLTQTPTGIKTTVCNFRAQDSQTFINSLELVP